MSFGLEVYDENGNLTFDIGKKYSIIVGSTSVPAQDNVTEAGLEYSFTLPETVPYNEELFAMGSVLNSPGVVYVSGRVVIVVRQGNFVRWNEGSGNIYNAVACTVFFGYYG